MGAIMKITEETIISSGLYPYIPWQIEEFPQSLHYACGKGLGLWQYPNQFAPYINMMIESGVKSYLEIGVAAGGTFMFTANALRRNGSGPFYAIDVAPPGEVNYINNESSPFLGKLNLYLMNNRDCTFLQCNSRQFVDIVKPKTIDLILIDGDHSYDGVRNDFEAVKDIGKILAFHDIVNTKCPGVGKFWSELKTSGLYDYHEFTDQYGMDKTYLGIGVAIKK